MEHILFYVRLFQGLPRQMNIMEVFKKFFLVWAYIEMDLEHNYLIFIQILTSLCIKFMLILYLEVHSRMDLVFFLEILIIFKLRFQSSMKELFFFIIFRVNILQVLEHIWFFVFLSLLFQLNKLSSYYYINFE